MRVIGVIALAAAAGVAGCGKSADQQRADQTFQRMTQGAQPGQRAQAGQRAQPGAQGPAQSAPRFQQLLQNTGGGQQAKPVNFEDLKSLMPTPGGWTKSDVSGTQESVPYPTSHAEAHYSRGDSRMTLEVTDTGFAQMVLAPITMLIAAGYEEQSDSGFKKTMTIGGEPAYEEWQQAAKHGEATVLVGKRFIVAVKGDRIDSFDPLGRLVEGLDIKKLAAMK